MFDPYVPEFDRLISDRVLHISIPCCYAPGVYRVCGIRYHSLVDVMVTILSDCHKNIRPHPIMIYYTGRHIPQYVIGQEVD